MRGFARAVRLEECASGGSPGASTYAHDRAVDDLDHLTGQLRSAVLAQTPPSFFGIEPSRVAMTFDGRNQPLDFTEVRVDRHHLPARAHPLPLGVKIPVKGDVLDPAFDSRLFVRLACSCGSGSSIPVNPALGKGPSTTSRTNQQKLRLASLHAVANCSNMYAFACGFRSKSNGPLEGRQAASTGIFGGYRHREFPASYHIK
jgi:hypothetical protein